MLCGFSSLWWPSGWNWSYLGFLGIIWRTCGSKCRGEGGGIYPTLCIECCLVFHINRTKSLLSYLWDRLPNTIFLEPVSDEEVEGIINNLKDSAPGYDEITTSVNKFSLPVIRSPLPHITCICWKVFPNELKVANVLPLYKADDDMLFNNYRSVSLFSVLSKVFE